MKQFGKILKFELKGYLKNKVFVGVTIFLVAAIAIAMFIPNILSAFKFGTTPPATDLPAMLVYAEDETLSGTVKEFFAQAFPGYHVKVADGTPDDIKSQITSGSVACAFVLNSPSSYTYYVGNLNMRDANRAIANTVLQEVYRVNAMIQNGLSPEQANNIMSVVIESDTMTLGVDQIKNDFYTYIMIFALYTVIMLYRQPVATNVASEKSSRYGSSDYERKADEHDVRKGFCVLYRGLYATCACVRLSVAALSYQQSTTANPVHRLDIRYADKPVCLYARVLCPRLFDLRFSLRRNRLNRVKT